MAQLPVHQPEWIDSAPVVVKRQRTVLAPPAAVWKHIADHEKWPQWFKGLKSVKVTGAAEGVGGQRVVSVTGATVGEVFTAWEPNERFAFAVIAGPRVVAGLAESVVIEPDGDGCIVTYTQGFEAAPGFAWLVKLGSKRMTKMLEKALDALALRAEADHAGGASEASGTELDTESEAEAEAEAEPVVESKPAAADGDAAVDPDPDAAESESED